MVFGAIEMLGRLLYLRVVHPYSTLPPLQWHAWRVQALGVVGPLLRGFVSLVQGRSRIGLGYLQLSLEIVRALLSTPQAFVPVR